MKFQMRLQASFAMAFVGFTLAQAPASAASRCPTPLIGGELSGHSVADTIRELAQVLYQPFAHYPFGDDGLCIDPAMFQVFTNVYLRTSEGYAPQIQSLCINRPRDGELTIQWTLGPTPEGALLVEAGENEEYVETHDFWRVAAPAGLICSEKIELKELVLERQGGFDVHIDPSGEKSAEIDVQGISVNTRLPDSGLPAFLTGDVGIDALIANEQDLFTLDLSAPFFNIPISATDGAASGSSGDSQDSSWTIDILGIHFKIR